MSTVEKDEIREERIDFEVIVDANGPEEQAMGWFYYLDDKISVPFKAKCIAIRTISPLDAGEEVEVLGLTSEDECEHEMFVKVKWHGRGLGVPLAQIAVVKADEATEEAVEDWHYWVNRGYEF
ncbi:MAG: calcium-binding protein [Chlorobium sp.]